MLGAGSKGSVRGARLVAPTTVSDDTNAPLAAMAGKAFDMIAEGSSQR